MEWLNNCPANSVWNNRRPAIGEIEANSSRDRDELLVHEMDLGMVREVRDTWQFFRDRRPGTYGPLCEVE